ncbi:hypothetical protein [Nocardia bovistercoris]|uniref:LysM domain-containing protein n=1 Tax=Nocardia bovistercoris TaxID=2785916 RepID=A0A931N1C1_9NOCA|nr:hypothetical protein [Nocardia bovistercoris]MBH0775552.1 hypothetical protein [Nocardia bovistercoris]
MAVRHSRYRDPTVTLPPDVHGRAPATTPLRRRPATTGTFRHVVAEGERLDQLAYRYYEESTAWWRICDANAAFLSPLELLGQEPVFTVRIPLLGLDIGPAPDWRAVVGALTAIVGVEDVAVAEDIEYVAAAAGFAREVFERALVVRCNRTLVTIGVLLAAIRDAGLSGGTPVETGRLGREIVIPPPSAV